MLKKWIMCLCVPVPTQSWEDSSTHSSSMKQRIESARSTVCFPYSRWDPWYYQVAPSLCCLAKFTVPRLCRCVKDQHVYHQHFPETVTRNLKRMPAVNIRTFMVFFSILACVVIKLSGSNQSVDESGPDILTCWSECFVTKKISS